MLGDQVSWSYRKSPKGVINIRKLRVFENKLLRRIFGLKKNES
jgi:hypothetical protein